MKKKKISVLAKKIQRKSKSLAADWNELIRECQTAKERSVKGSVKYRFTPWKVEPLQREDDVINADDFSTPWKNPIKKEEKSLNESLIKYMGDEADLGRKTLTKEKKKKKKKHKQCIHYESKMTSQCDCDNPEKDTNMSSMHKKKRKRNDTQDMHSKGEMSSQCDSGSLEHNTIPSTSSMRKKKKKKKKDKMEYQGRQDNENICSGIDTKVLSLKGCHSKESNFFEEEDDEFPAGGKKKKYNERTEEAGDSKLKKKKKKNKLKNSMNQISDLDDYKEDLFQDYDFQSGGEKKSKYTEKPKEIVGIKRKKKKLKNNMNEHEISDIDDYKEDVFQGDDFQSGSKNKSMYTEKAMDVDESKHKKKKLKNNMNEHEISDLDDYKKDLFQDYDFQSGGEKKSMYTEKPKEIVGIKHKKKKLKNNMNEHEITDIDDYKEDVFQGDDFQSGSKNKSMYTEKAMDVEESKHKKKKLKYNINGHEISDIDDYKDDVFQDYDFQSGGEKKSMYTEKPKEIVGIKHKKKKLKNNINVHEISDIDDYKEDVFQGDDFQSGSKNKSMYTEKAMDVEESKHKKKKLKNNINGHEISDIDDYKEDVFQDYDFQSGGEKKSMYTEKPKEIVGIKHKKKKLRNNISGHEISDIDDYKEDVFQGDDFQSGSKNKSMYTEKAMDVEESKHKKKKLKYNINGHEISDIDDYKEDVFQDYDFQSGGEKKSMYTEKPKEIVGIKHKKKKLKNNINVHEISDIDDYKEDVFQGDDFQSGSKNKSMYTEKAMDVEESKHKKKKLKNNINGHEISDIDDYKEDVFQDYDFQSGGEKKSMYTEKPKEIVGIKHKKKKLKNNINGHEISDIDDYKEDVFQGDDFQSGSKNKSMYTEKAMDVEESKHKKKKLKNNINGHEISDIDDYKEDVFQDYDFQSGGEKKSMYTEIPKEIVGIKHKKKKLKNNINVHEISDIDDYKEDVFQDEDFQSGSKKKSKYTEKTMEVGDSKHEKKKAVSSNYSLEMPISARNVFSDAEENREMNLLTSSQKTDLSVVGMDFNCLSPDAYQCNRASYLSDLPLPTGCCDVLNLSSGSSNSSGNFIHTLSRENFKTHSTPESGESKSSVSSQTGVAADNLKNRGKKKMKGKKRNAGMINNSSSMSTERSSVSVADNSEHFNISEEPISSQKSDTWGKKVCNKAEISNTDDPLPQISVASSNKGVNRDMQKNLQNQNSEELCGSPMWNLNETNASPVTGITNNSMQGNYDCIFLDSHSHASSGNMDSSDTESDESITSLQLRKLARSRKKQLFTTTSDTYDSDSSDISITSSRKSLRRKPSKRNESISHAKPRNSERVIYSSQYPLTEELYVDESSMSEDSEVLDIQSFCSTCDSCMPAYGDSSDCHLSSDMEDGDNLVLRSDDCTDGQIADGPDESMVSHESHNNPDDSLKMQLPAYDVQGKSQNLNKCTRESSNCLDNNSSIANILVDGAENTRNAPSQDRSRTMQNDSEALLEPSCKSSNSVSNSNSCVKVEPNLGVTPEIPDAISEKSALLPQMQKKWSSYLTKQHTSDSFISFPDSALASTSNVDTFDKKPLEYVDTVNTIKDDLGYDESLANISDTDMRSEEAGSPYHWPDKTILKSEAGNLKSSYIKIPASPSFESKLGILNESKISPVTRDTDSLISISNNDIVKSRESPDTMSSKWSVTQQEHTMVSPCKRQLFTSREKLSKPVDKFLDRVNIKETCDLEFEERQENHNSVMQSKDTHVEDGEESNDSTSYIVPSVPEKCLKTVKVIISPIKCGLKHKRHTSKLIGASEENSEAGSSVSNNVMQVCDNSNSACVNEAVPSLQCENPRRRSARLYKKSLSSKENSPNISLHSRSVSNHDSDENELSSLSNARQKLMERIQMIIGNTSGVTNSKKTRGVIDPGCQNECISSDEELVDFDEDLISEIRKLLDANACKLQNIDHLSIDITWKCPLAHTICTSLIHLLEAKHRQKLLKNHIKVSEEPFSGKEDQVIMKNWRKFCREYDVSDPSPFVDLYRSGLDLKQRTRFIQYIGRTLDNRTLHYIYRRFQYLMDKHVDTLFSREEDELIKYLVTKYAVNFETLSKIFTRDSCLLSVHYQKLKEGISSSRVKEKCNIKWTLEMKSKLVSAILSTMDSTDIEELRKPNITVNWKKVEILSGIPANRAACYWNFCLYTQVFLNKPLANITILADVIKKLYRMNITKKSNINWEPIARDFCGANASYISIQFQHSIYRLVKKRSLSLREKMAYLYKNYIPKVKKRPLKYIQRLRWDASSRKLIPIT